MMRPEDLIVIGLIILFIGGAVFYIVRAKRKGQKCIGCPYAKECAKAKKSSGCTCGSADRKET